MSEKEELGNVCNENVKAFQGILKSAKTIFSRIPW